jgi:replicative DNA helicase
MSVRDDIIAANPLEPFLRQRGYDLRPAGKNWRTNACPVTQHQRWHRPVTVDWQRNLWHCNDCKLGGTVIDWVMREKNVTAAEAMRELAGGLNRSEPVAGLVKTSPSQSGKAPAANHDVTFDWSQNCVAPLTPKELIRLGNERWYSRQFCTWLHEKNYVGVVHGDFAFPVQAEGNILAAHYRVKAKQVGEKDDWFYFPVGIGARPFVIGDLTKAKQVHIGESQWDMLALADRTDLYLNQNHAFAATRGAGNAALCNGLIPEGVSVLAWPQNDEAGKRWLDDLSTKVPVQVGRAIVPEQFKDVNEWTKSGASAEDIYAAIFRNELVEKPEIAELVSETKTDGANRDEPNEAAEPFPLHCLPSLVEAMAKEVCATERVPESLAGCCALGILSASIGAGLAVQSASNRVTRGNIYLLASAESGSGKSETFRHMAKPFQQFEMDRIKRWKELERPDALAKRGLLEVDIKKCKKQYAAKKHDDDIGEEVKKFELEREELQKRLDAPTLSCEDVTTEKLADLLSKNDEQLASLSADALSTVNNLLGRYNKLDRTDEGLYLKAYSGDPYVVHRMSREPISLESPCLTALWLTQPDKLRSLLDERSLNEGGLIPRILACHTNCEPREIGKNPPSISSSVEKAYAGLIFCLLETYRLAPELFTIKPTSEALRALNDHHDAIVKRRRGELRDVTSYAARWNEQGWRIAVCLHAGTHGSQAHEQPVALETAQRAIALADWFAAEQLRILNVGRTQRKIERLQRLKELIGQQYNGLTTLRALHRNNGFEPDETRELAAKFPGSLVIEKRETGGRPSEIVSLPKKSENFQTPR